jgi:beta-glucosidase-like glycosyl hydrolase
VPAAFSVKTIGGMLQSELRFCGVVISDSLAAKQLRAWSLAAHALTFVNASGGMILMTDPAQIPVTVNAVLARAKADSTSARGERRDAERSCSPSSGSAHPRLT